MLNNEEPSTKPHVAARKEMFFSCDLVCFVDHRRRPFRGLFCLVALFFAAIAAPSLAQTGLPRSLSAVRSQAQFDSIASTPDPDTPYALPHVLFVIDRKDRNKIYYVN